MKRTRLSFVLLLLGSLSAAQGPTGGAAEIEQLQVKRDGADVTIQIMLTGAVQPAVETATNPDRLVLVLPGTLSDAKQKHFPLDANGVRGVRVGLNSANPPVTRVVVDLKEAHAYTLSADGKAITLRVQSPENALAARRNGPAPAASAPLMDVFHRKPPTPASDANAAPAPIPVPPKFPPINFPEKHPATTATATPATAPSAAHPKLGSLQQGTVFPGMGTPGTGSIPAVQNEKTGNGQASTASAAATPAATQQVTAKVTPAPAVGAVPAATMKVNVAPTDGAQPNAGQTTAMVATVASNGESAKTVAPSGKAATVPDTPAVATSAAPGLGAASSPTSAGSPNVTAKILSATVANSTPAPSTAATVSNPLGLTPSTAVAAANPSASKPSDTSAKTPVSTAPVAATTPVAANNAAPSGPQGATVANPLGLPQKEVAKTATPAAAPQGATVANPLGLPQNDTAQAASAAPAVPQGATVANPLGLAPGETAQIEVVEEAPETPVASAEVTAEAIPNNAVATKAVEPDIPAALALRATHPDFRTAFRVKYVAAGSAYLDGGRGAGLAEGMKLVVRQTPTGSAVAAASGNEDDIIAELEVSSVAEASAVTDIHTPKRDVKPGDLAYLSAHDEQALVQQNTLSATRKYPTVISFTEGDTLDEEARVQIPRPPMPSVNRARGRVGVDYMGTMFHGNAAGTNSNVGLVARMDMTRIGGTYWNLSGYWRGQLTSSSYTATPTVQDLLNRTYHLSMTYDNPNSPWVAGFGRMYLPWATSLETIDGGYFGRRLGHGATAGVFAGSTPDPTSYSYNPDQRIGGAFINFEGGSFDSLRYTSTSGLGLSTIGWKVNRPFAFFENAVYYKRYVAIYDSLQADSPVGYQAGGSPGAGIGRNFLTVRVQPHERIEFDANYTYFRDLPTFNTALVSTTLLDKYLFQGFSGGVRLEVLKNVWVYTNLGQSNASGDKNKSLNQLYGLTLGRIPWVQIRADAHYARFNSSFGSGNYEAVSLSRTLSDNFRLEVLGGKQSFVSSLSNNNSSRFITSNLEMNVGAHYFLQGGYTVSRGVTQDYDQWLMTLGYRFDSRRAKGQ
jgi:AMIN domain-containing protein